MSARKALQAILAIARRHEAPTGDATDWNRVANLSRPFGEPVALGFVSQGPERTARHARPFSQLRDQMSPEAQARSAARTAEMLADLDRWCHCQDWATVDGQRCTVCGKPIAQETA